jgi:hypothetical protein
VCEDLALAKDSHSHAGETLKVQPDARERAREMSSLSVAFWQGLVHSFCSVFQNIQRRMVSRRHLFSIFDKGKIP